MTLWVLIASALVFAAVLRIRFAVMYRDGLMLAALFCGLCFLIANLHVHAR